MGRINTYSATLYTGGSESNLQCKAMINCYNDTQPTPVMTAYFYHEGYFIPPNSKHIDKVNLRYSILDYNNFLDLLRNESPVFFYYNEHSKIGYLRTGQESIIESTSETRRIKEFTI
ncbi:hypothetical protein [Lutimonas sp.]|uniref:hypothetical protein n=1 Tax=Lutimonas sp. TaxID=1872403 RepID=UPI003D9AED63